MKLATFSQYFIEIENMCTMKFRFIPGAGESDDKLEKINTAPLWPIVSII